MTDLIGGQIDLICDQITTAMPQVEGKRMRSYAVTTPHRLVSAALKDTPTMQESGYKDFSVTIWQGLYAPKGTSAPILKKFSDALKLAVKDPEFIKKQELGGASVITDSRVDPAGHKSFVLGGIDKWAPLIKASGAYARLLEVPLQPRIKLAISLFSWLSIQFNLDLNKRVKIGFVPTNWILVRSSSGRSQKMQQRDQHFGWGFALGEMAHACQQVAFIPAAKQDFLAQAGVCKIDTICRTVQ
jgi:hypothetical protein